MVEIAASSPTEALATFASGLSFGDLPADVVAHAELCLLDALGCGIFAAELPWCRMVDDLVQQRSAAGVATIWGTSHTSTADGAALANGTAGHGFELDDIHPGGMHPGPLAVSVALALGEELGSSGREVVTGIVAGYEVGCRVAMAMIPGHARAGFHAQGTVGAFVAAATAGRMLGLDPVRMRHAFGVVGSMAAGLLVAQEGGMTKRLHSGRAAQSGVEAALLAQAGFTGAPDVLESPLGFCRAMGGGKEDLVALTAGLGETWETLRVGFKIYPSCGGSHSGIHGARTLRREHDFTADDVVAVHVVGSSHAVMKVGAPYQPNGVTGAQMNLAFMMALMLRFGECPLDQLTDEGIVDPATLAVAERISMTSDSRIDEKGPLGRHESRVEIDLVGGRTVTATTPFRPGSQRMPVSVDDVREKFRSLTSLRMPAEQVAAIEDTVFRVPNLDRIDDLTALLAVPSRRAEG